MKVENQVDESIYDALLDAREMLGAICALVKYSSDGYGDGQKTVEAIKDVLGLNKPDPEEEEMETRGCRECGATMSCATSFSIDGASPYCEDCYNAWSEEKKG